MPFLNLANTSLVRYNTIQRLVNDTSPKNTYRHAIYASITGGGYGAQPLFFATDSTENRYQRLLYGQLINTCGILRKGDWALTTHAAGELYRSLDLILESIENAGACAISAGNHMSPADVVGLLIKYHINAVTGDSSQMVQLTNYIASLSPEEKSLIKLEKLIYTSEVLTAAQRAHVRATLGQDIQICSFMASAEAGPWAVSNPAITGPINDHVAEFIFDKRTMLIEILPLSSATDGAELKQPLAMGETGIIVQTCLAKLRNPLIRYVTGDVGSLHPLPESARDLIPATEWEHLQVLRLHGRDRRFSFDWDGEYLDFADISAIINDEKYRIVQWQVILKKADGNELEAALDIRLMPAKGYGDDALREELVTRVKTFVHAVEINSHKFSLKFIDRLDEFERSTTGRKVVKFLDRYSD